MNLELIKYLRDTFGERYMTSDDLFRKSLNTVATPAMGHERATVWIIADNVRGEDIVRRHYETMLQCDKELTGLEQHIDPYGGPRELGNRLKQQGYDIQMTIYPSEFEKQLEHVKLYVQMFQSKLCDIQAVCYNLTDRVMPTEEMENQL